MTRSLQNTIVRKVSQAQTNNAITRHLIKKSGSSLAGRPQLESPHSTLNSETDFNKILPKYNGLKSELNSIDKEIEKREKELAHKMSGSHAPQALAAEGHHAHIKDGSQIVGSGFYWQDTFER